MKAASALTRPQSRELFIFNAESAESRSSAIALFQPTKKCNLKCVSCPQPREERYEPDLDANSLIAALASLPSNLLHLTISGGEPTLRFDLISNVLEMFRNRAEPVSIQLLTNAVMLKQNSLCARLRAVSPQSLVIGVPLYAGHADLHDAITCMDGSFTSTVQAITNLLSLGARVEIRVIVSRLTINDLPTTAAFISKNMHTVERVLFIAPELHGCARDNALKVWQDPHEQAPSLIKATHILRAGDVRVSLYNYPLCTIPESLWSISADSISPWKKAFSKCCDACTVRRYCAGFFTCNKDVMNSVVCPVIARH